jgi:hypothetical protein
MQHTVTEVSSREDEFQRRLGERENEIKNLRLECQSLRD